MSHKQIVRAVVSAALFAILLLGCAKDPVKEKAKFVASAQKHMAAQEYNEAVIEFRNALKLEPASSQLQLELGDAYFKSGQYREAYLAYKKAAELDAKNVPAQLAL